MAGLVAVRATMRAGMSAVNDTVPPETVAPAGRASRITSDDPSAAIRAENDTLAPTSDQTSSALSCQVVPPSVENCMPSPPTCVSTWSAPFSTRQPVAPSVALAPMKRTRSRKSLRRISAGVSTRSVMRTAQISAPLFKGDAPPTLAPKERVANVGER